MLTCNLQGGLGNQLFQIFTTISYSLKTSESFFFQNKYQLTNAHDINNGATVRYTYWETFLKALSPFVKDQDKLPNLELFFKEQGFKYDQAILMNLLNNPKKIKMLVGYFQSYKYFDIYRSAIFKVIKLEFKQIIMREIHKATIDFDSTVSIHFRLGDYKKLQDIHPILTDDYYINALNYIVSLCPTNKSNKIRTVLYFCEDGDYQEVVTRIYKLQSIFADLIFERADNTLYDWEQLLLMSLCQDNIIANSTFSWWGAYFNTNYNKTVCYPSTWFGEKVGHNTSDLFPEDWVQIVSL